LNHGRVIHPAGQLVARTGTRRIVLDFSRLRNGEIVAAVGGLALFSFMFFDWFGGGVEIAATTQDVPGIGEVPSGTTVEESGLSAWDALSDFSGFLIALSAVSGVALGGLAASGQRLNLGGIPRGAGTAALGSLAVLLILWRFLANPGDLKIGIFLGLAAAVAVAVGALMALREDGFEPLVKVAGGRTRAAAASAPAATPTPMPVSAPAGGSTKARSSGGSSAGRSRSSGESATKTRSRGSTAKSRSSGGGAAKSRSRSGGAAKSRSGGSRSRGSASKSSSSGPRKTKSRSGGRKTTTKRSSTASRSRSSGSSRLKTSSRSKSPSRSKTSSRSKSSGSTSRSKSGGSRSRSSGARRRSSGGRK
jgi:hypothetical protein